jgi:predicted Zn finger-like uncharacterized protein
VQAFCPQCANKLVIDDAKVPDRPFQVKCPKCQTPVKFPGRTAAGAEATPAPEEVASTGGAGAASAEEMRAQMMAQLRREMSLGEKMAGGARALLAVPDRALAGTVTVMLTRLGYQVDPLDERMEGGRLLEQGLYEVVVTTRAGAAPGRPETLYQRVSRLNPEGRRRLFVALVGDEFKTGDGTQAFACLADLVIHSRDVASADALLHNTLMEKTHIYQAFNEARRRHEASAS